MGQSNMAGRGQLEGKAFRSARVWVYRSGTNENISPNEYNMKLPAIDSFSWQIASEPLFDDRTDIKAGTCLATTFAREYLQRNPSHHIGFIPVER
uniref:Sialate O-acetylesterase domain-containing protein n=1 Tax=Vannella robusta TaxID=1487602 RepID=A0A7S4MNZ3_9EUKA